MADNLTTLGLLTLAQNFRGDVVRQINRSVQLLKTITITSGEGKNVAWATEAAGALVENYAEGADAVNFGGDVQGQAVLTWALYRANPHVTKLAMDGAASSATPMGNRALWARTVTNHAAALAANLNVECFSGPGTGTRIAGLDVAIATDNNTYAGVDRTQGANSFWKPTVIAPGADTDPTFQLLRDDLRKIYEVSGETPDLAIGCPAVFNKIGSLFDATRRQIENVNTRARGGVFLDAGFHALELDGVIIMKDKDATKTATSGTLYYLNTDNVQLQYLPDANQDALLDRMQMKVQANDGFGTVPLGFTYEMLAKTGPSEKAEILSTCQLVVKRPNTCGARLQVKF